MVVGKVRMKVKCQQERRKSFLCDLSNQNNDKSRQFEGVVEMEILDQKHYDYRFLQYSIHNREIILGLQ